MPILKDLELTLDQQKVLTEQLLKRHYFLGADFAREGDRTHLLVGRKARVSWYRPKKEKPAVRMIRF